MAVTMLKDLIDPQVLADMIDAELPKAIRFAGIAPVDYTLVGQPGSTITVPKYKYIGDAVVVAEGAPIDYTALATESAPYTIHKIAKGVEVTDEAKLSGYGDPNGQAVKQIVMAIASAVDNQTLDEVNKTTLTATATGFGADLVEAIENAFDDEDAETGVIFMSPKDAIKHRRAVANDWTRASKLGDELLVKGVFGEALGWQVVRTKKVEDGAPRAVKAGALKTFLKRETKAESGRDMDHKKDKYNADKHFVVALVDESKAIKVDVTVTP